MDILLNPEQTAARLPWAPLVDEIEALLTDASVSVPPRTVLPMAAGAFLFAMPGCDARTAMTKLITFTPANMGTGRPTIQGDVTVFDVASGERPLILDGPTVTARRTAAVSALAARWLAADLNGPMLIVGAGVQGQAHIEVFAAALGVTQFRIASRRRATAEALAEHARVLGLQAEVVDDADAALADCPLAATCTPASEVVLRAAPLDPARLGDWAYMQRRNAAALPLTQRLHWLWRRLIPETDFLRKTYGSDASWPRLLLAHWRRFALRVSATRRRTPHP